MKNLLKYILIFSAAAFLLWTCKEPEYDIFGAVYGTVTDAGTKEPVSGAQVILSPGNLTAVTGSSGTYEFLELEAGQYRLAVSAQDYNTDSRQVTVVSGERILCDMQLSPVKQEAGMELSKTSLDFGTQSDELTFDIKNTGNAGALDWAITNLTAEWLSVSPMEGRVDVDKSSSVKVAIDRRLIDKDVSTTFNVEAAGGSQAVKVSVRFDDGSTGKAKMRLSATQLDFGTEHSEMTFDVINDGISEDLTWNISEITADWLSVTLMNGTTAAGKSSSVKVMVNRSAITEEAVSSVITVNAEGASESVEVTVRQTEEEKPQLELSVTQLDFGTDYSELSFEIRNTAETVSMDWEITDVSAGWLSFSRTSGTTDAGAQTSVIARVDRTLITSDANTVFTVEAEGGLSKSVNVSVKYENGNEDPEEPGGEGTEDVTAGLYVYYKFEDDFDDASGNDVHGFGSNSPEFTDGVQSGSKAVRFQRTQNSCMTVPSPIIDSRNMTISFWAKDLADGNIFYMVSSYDNDPMFSLSMSGGSLKFVVTRYDVWYQYDNMRAFSHVNLSDGNWHHIVLTSDFNQTTYAKITTTLYVDGQKMDIVTEDANPFSEDGNSSQSSYGTGTKFVMGGEVKISSSKTLNGANMVIDNFRVYDTRILSDAEIKQIYDFER